MIAERVHPRAVLESVCCHRGDGAPAFGVPNHPTNFRMTLAAISVHYVPP